MNGYSKEYFEFVDDITLADIAIHCKAQTVERIFALNAEALLHVCLEDPSKLKRNNKYHIEVQHTYLDLLLVKFLNELIFVKDTKGLLLYPGMIKLINSNDKLVCEADFTGDYVIKGYDIIVDPKAATMHKAKCEQIDKDEWESFIVIDV